MSQILMILGKQGWENECGAAKVIGNYCNQHVATLSDPNIHLRTALNSGVPTSSLLLNYRTLD
jgi:hypothetical protein